MIWIGLAIVLATFWLIYKNYEARLVLTLSGVLMAADRASGAWVTDDGRSRG